MTQQKPPKKKIEMLDPYHLAKLDSAEARKK